MGGRLSRVQILSRGVEAPDPASPIEPLRSPWLAGAASAGAVCFSSLFDRVVCGFPAEVASGPHTHTHIAPHLRHTQSTPCTRVTLPLYTDTTTTTTTRMPHINININITIISDNKICLYVYTHIHHVSKAPRRPAPLRCLPPPHFTSLRAAQPRSSSRERARRSILQRAAHAHPGHTGTSAVYLVFSRGSRRCRVSLVGHSTIAALRSHPEQETCPPGTFPSHGVHRQQWLRSQPWQEPAPPRDAPHRPPATVGGPGRARTHRRQPGPKPERALCRTPPARLSAPNGYRRCRLRPGAASRSAPVHHLTRASTVPRARPSAPRELARGRLGCALAPVPEAAAGSSLCIFIHVNK